MSVLVAENLHVRLGRRPILHGVNLTVSSGMIGLIGANGAGKSTLLRSLAGLLAPTSGAVTLDDVPIRAMNARMRARRIGYLAQSAEIHWRLTVRALVSLGRAPYGGAGDIAAIDRAMVAADITHLTDRPAADLSGGERARVLLARALAGEPDILLADEPIAGLDPLHQLRTMALFQEIAASGRLVLAALHDLTLTGRFCDRIILMREGRIAAFGPPAAVLTPENLAAAYGVHVEMAEFAGETAVLPWRPL